MPAAAPVPRAALCSLGAALVGLLVVVMVALAAVNDGTGSATAGVRRAPQTTKPTTPDDDAAVLPAPDGGATEDQEPTTQVGARFADQPEQQKLESDAKKRVKPASPVTCVPQACRAPVHFLEDKALLQNANEWILLSSLPGSGNTWIRSVVEEATRLWSGSVYHDERLFRAGFRGEMEIPWEHRHSRYSVIKSHWPFFDISVPHKVSAAVHLLRSPFDAVLSEYNREYGGGHVQVASNAQLRSGSFKRWADLRIDAWVRDMDAWLGKRFWEKPDWVPSWTETWERASPPTSSCAPCA